MNNVSKKIVNSITNRTADTHKGHYGRAFCVVGSYGMAGAAIISGLSTLKCGVGICDICLPDTIYPIVATNIPEAVYSIYKNQNECYKCLFNGVNKATAVLVGCGSGNTNATRDIVKYLIDNAEIPLVIDADGINVLKYHIDILEARKRPTIITPHIGEMSRLTGLSIDYIKGQKENVALNFASKYGVIVVLKDHNTVVASPDGKTYINHTGNPGMATGGSGDMLAGMITSLVAQGYDAFESAVAGVNLHGIAGDMAKDELTEAAMLPTDMIKMLPKVFKMFIE
ncbi:MAG: NAD(P)H-hydrate dehydratase [Clostridia bacterium]|nr:NAD(P)H-hydrate dehydratase [Clostridia bacterium]